MTEKRQILRSTSVITLATLTSRLFGYIRDQRVALLLGTSVVSDSFYLAFRIPSVLRRVVAEGAMSASFVPVFTSVQAERTEEETMEFASRLFWTLAVVLAIVTMLGMIFAPAIIRLFTFMGHDPAQWASSVELMRIMFPFIFFIGLSALSMGILNCYKVFAVPALTPAISNIAIIIFSTALVWRWFHSAAISLAIGVAVGGLLQFLMQLPQLVRKGMRFRLGISFSDPGIQRIAMLMIPGVFGLGVAQINVIVDTLFLTSSRMPMGSVSSLYYADRIMQLVLGSYAVAVATAILPMMSRQARAMDFAAVKQTLGFAVRIVTFITIPATVGILMLRQPIIRVLFQHGQFGVESTILTARALLFYVTGLPAISAVKLIVQAFYSTRDTRTPVLIAASVLVLNIVLNSLFLVFLISRLKNGGPALATAISAYVNCGVLFWIFRGRHGRIGAREILRSSGKVIAAAALMGSLCWLAVQYGHVGSHPSLGMDAALLGATIAGAVAIYLGLSWLFRARELREVYEIVFHRKAAGAAEGVA
ncbi:MAG TPA: murein biosynthesis integral membrane protein MurJ [Candidatus Acidoferrales bacterium]|nr:murein biosynthesis integral membrane protein MurJ [Candidatus Acidoferrales bacterium]